LAKSSRKNNENDNFSKILIPQLSMRTSMNKKRVGSIRGLWIYPVKSMLGESRAEIFFEQRGVVGDRLYAVRDVLGKFRSGKNTRRFCRIDGLFNFKAHYEGVVPQLTFPSGEIIGGDNPSVHSELSRALDKKVTLARVILAI
jgi:hypothetical protein